MREVLPPTPCDWVVAIASSVLECNKTHALHPRKGSLRPQTRTTTSFLATIVAMRLE